MNLETARERVQETLDLMKYGEGLTSEEKEELFNRPEVNKWDARIILDVREGGDGKSFIIDGEFYEVKDLRLQIAIVLAFFNRMKDFIIEQYNPERKPVLPAFNWKNWNENKAMLEEDNLLKRTAVTALFAITGSIC